jgi:hypothetical protein
MDSICICLTKVPVFLCHPVFLVRGGNVLTDISSPWRCEVWRLIFGDRRLRPMMHSLMCCVFSGRELSRVGKEATDVWVGAVCSCDPHFLPLALLALSQTSTLTRLHFCPSDANGNVFLF